MNKRTFYCSIKNAEFDSLRIRCTVKVETTQLNSLPKFERLMKELCSSFKLYFLSAKDY